MAVRGNLVAVALLLISQLIGAAVGVAPEAATGSDWWQLQIANLASGVSLMVTVVEGRINGSEAFGILGDDALGTVLALQALPVGVTAGGAFRFQSPTGAFEPVRPYAQVGDRWSTQWAGAIYDVSVETVRGDRMRLSYRPVDGQGALRSAIFDRSLGYFERFETDLSVAALVAHGTDPVGPVAYPERWHAILSLRREFGQAVGGISVPEIVAWDVPPGSERAALRLVVGGTSNERSVLEAVSPRGERYAVHKPTASGNIERVEALGDASGMWKSVLAGSTQDFARISMVAYDLGTFAPAHEASTRATRGALRAEGVSFDEGWLLNAFLGALVGWGAWTGRGRWLAFMPFVARLQPGQVLDHPVRRRLLEAIARHPGRSAAALRAELDLPWTTLRHHLRVLERHELASSQAWLGCRGWFPSEAHTLMPNGAALTAAARGAAGAVLDCIWTHPGIHLSEIARRLGLHHSTVLFHTRRLEGTGMLRAHRAGTRTTFELTAAANAALSLQRR